MPMVSCRFAAALVLLLHGPLTPLRADDPPQKAEMAGYLLVKPKE